MNFDINRMIMESLNVNDCLFIYFCYNKDTKLYNFYREQFGSVINRDRLLYLIDLGYIEYINPEDKKLIFENLNPTPKSNFIFSIKELAKKEEVPVNKLDWMEEWYTLFPKGIKSGGYPIRSGLNTCRVKMFKFLKRNKFANCI